jgi:hypothetical protein
MLIAMLIVAMAAPGLDAWDEERAEENSAQNIRMGSESGWRRQLRRRDE